MTSTNPRRPTMRDVAHTAGVSLKTVSRVVNAEDGVSADLAERVEQAIRKLQYQPDERARNLRQSDSRSGSIGFVMVDVSNPFFSSILRGLEDVARARNCFVLSGSSDGDADREDQLIETFISRRVDGLVVIPSGDELASLRAEVERGTPVVFLDLEAPGFTCDLVRSDHRGGARSATEHLVHHGHRDIAFLCDDTNIFSAGERLAGFQDAMADAGLAVRSEWVVTGRHRPDEWRPLVAALLQQEQRPTAIFTAQNFISIGALQALHELQLHRTVAMVGFDDVELADVVEPGLTVVPQQPRELGRRAGMMLFDRLDGSTDPQSKVVVASPLILRGSGEIPPSHWGRPAGS
ncbi:MAG: LacI family DNA-binding transcriptional regulator [Ilumatobacteraceae bacterium]